MDWIKITKDPLSKTTAEEIREHLRGISKLYNKELVGYFCDTAD